MWDCDVITKNARLLCRIRLLYESPTQILTSESDEIDMSEKIARIKIVHFLNVIILWDLYCDPLESWEFHVFFHQIRD